MTLFTTIILVAKQYIQYHGNKNTSISH